MSGGMSAIGTKRTSKDVPSNVRFWGKSGHRADIPSCVIFSQSGHLPGL